MEPTVEDLRRIDLLIEQEETIGRLYKTYAARLPELSALWSSLAVEEKSHAAQLRQLKTKVESGAFRFDGTRFDSVSLEAGIAELCKEAQRAEAGPLTPQHALLLALRLERAIVQQGYFRAFSREAQDGADVVKSLDSLTEGHIQRLVESAREHGVHQD